MIYSDIFSQKENANSGNCSNNTVGRVIVFHIADLNSIARIPYNLLRTTKSKSWVQSQDLTWSVVGKKNLCPKNQTKNYLYELIITSIFICTCTVCWRKIPYSSPKPYYRLNIKCQRKSTGNNALFSYEADFDSIPGPVCSSSAQPELIPVHNWGWAPKNVN